MSMHNIPFSIKKGSYGFYSKGFKKEFETAVVKEPPVFEPLKFYCTQHCVQTYFQ